MTTNVNEDLLKIFKQTMMSDVKVAAVQSMLHPEISRFRGAEWFQLATTQDVTLIGCGGIGSYVAFNLARIHVRNITIYDADIVSAENQSGQLFCMDDVDKAKVDAMKAFVHEYARYNNITDIKVMFSDGNFCNKITICAVDNMEARRNAFETWCVSHSGDQEALFIDGRLSPECLQVFAITGTDSYNINKYREEYLFTDEQADATVCSYKQTTFMASIIGGLITNIFVNHICNIQSGDYTRALPFFTEYEGPICNFKTIN